jgi:hypothetical protein
VNSNCQINYEISERDYLDAQKLAIKNHPRTFTRVVYRTLPYCGLLVGLGVFWVMFAWGFHWDWLMILPLAFTVFALSRPLLLKRAAKRAYRKTRSLHGPRSTAVDEQGMSFEGPDFSSQLKWRFFLKFAEDDKSFVMYQTDQMFFCIPKRQLSQQEISTIREELIQHIPKGK